MTLPGFELLFSSVQSQIRSLEDAAVIAIHWNIISHGFKCTGVGEKPQQNVKTESLPNGWNSSEIYELHYQDSKTGKRCVLKIVPVDGLLLVHFQRTDAENVASIDVRVDNFVTHDHTSVTNAYTSLEQLNSEVSNSLINPVMGSTSSSNSQNSSTKASNTHASSSRDYKRMEEESPLFVGERKAPPRQPQPVHPPWADPLGMDPFSVGRADLDPLGGMGGGGMFMDPRHIGPRFGPERGGPYGPQRGGGIHPGMLPPGAVPPGARFDPIGPGGMRGGPDPDHERPPEYDDMFM